MDNPRTGRGGAAGATWIVRRRLAGTGSLSLNFESGLADRTGGVGTLDEAWDAMALSQLGMANKRPVVLCNVDGYYDATLAQLQRAHAEGLTSKPPAAIVHSVGDVEAALDWCEKAVAAGGGVSGDRATARSRGIGAGAAFLCGVAVGAIAVVACRRR